MIEIAIVAIVAGVIGYGIGHYVGENAGYTQALARMKPTIPVAKTDVTGATPVAKPATAKKVKKATKVASKKKVKKARKSK